MDRCKVIKGYVKTDYLITLFNPSQQISFLIDAREGIEYNLLIIPYGSNGSSEIIEYTLPEGLTFTGK